MSVQISEAGKNPKLFEGPYPQCHDCEFGCGQMERALRHYSAYGYDKPMTSEEREWCIQEADRAGEGSYRREELERYNDQELATAVLRAWADYCRSQGLL
ncbi:MAG TPA: hypothetical protein PKV86_01155 [Syntrophobacteraceae bacterium]|nr:hypothetical protein [Syntrophobacteraceae bacterium]